MSRGSTPIRQEAKARTSRGKGRYVKRCRATAKEVPQADNRPWLIVESYGLDRECYNEKTKRLHYETASLLML